MVEQIISQLKRERIRQNMTLGDLALKSKVSVKHICNIENGKAMPSLDVLEKLAAALGIEIHAVKAS